MNSRRKEILTELGISPQWRIKSNNIKITEENQVTDMNWQQLKHEVMHCTACDLCQSRTHTVFGIGDENADWLYVGEGPGAKEDAIGEPFVGPAGKLLDNMLITLGLQRGRQVYIANVVKCRPPNNRNPDSNETKQCEPYLARQIELIKPKIIIALGKVAAQNLLKCNENISSMRGKLHRYAGIPLIVTYHPAYLLRSLQDKEKAWEDLCLAKATIQSLSE